jgi:hypothetical protein
MTSTLFAFQSSGFLPAGQLNTLVYEVPVDNEGAHHNRIVDACQTIPNLPGIFERMRRTTMRRVELCIGAHGENFEHLL